MCEVESQFSAFQRMPAHNTKKFALNHHLFIKYKSLTDYKNVMDQVTHNSTEGYDTLQFLCAALVSHILHLFSPVGF